MSVFQIGDRVVATLPNGWKSSEMFVTDTTEQLTTCAYVDDQKRLFTPTVPTAWLEKVRTIDEIIASPHFQSFGRG